jgi:hypothetical protein
LRQNCSMERIGRRRCKGACPGDKELGVPARRGIAAFMSAYALPAVAADAFADLEQLLLSAAQIPEHHLTAETALPGSSMRRPD